jgi:hypothetical protein
LGVTKHAAMLRPLRVALLQQSPKAGRVVGHDRVAKLVQQHMVHRRRLQEEQPRVEGDRSSRRAARPPSALTSYLGPLVRETVTLRQPRQTRHKQLARPHLQPVRQQNPRRQGPAPRLFTDHHPQRPRPVRPHAAPARSRTPAELDRPALARGRQHYALGKALQTAINRESPLRTGRGQESVGRRRGRP